MKTVRFALTALILFLCAVPLYAETEIKAEVDKTQVASNELIIYKLLVRSSEKKLPQPSLPDFKGFIIVSQAQSSSVSFSGGKTGVMNVFVFVLGPLASGTLTIAPATITVRGKEYSSESFEIQVSKDRVPQGAPLPDTFPESPSEEGPDLSGPRTTL